MPYEPLHHKYRPQTFNDLVGQETIALTLSNALKQEKIAPAYLFTGPRGTGKTSSARILAKSLNCLASSQPTPHPCGKCKSCLAIARGAEPSVKEIDAASHTGVDNIREIIERSIFGHIEQRRYKIYIIDECLTGDSLIQTSSGLMRIDNPELKGKKVLSYNENTNIWEYKTVIRWLERGTKKTLTIKTGNYQIRCTANHLIRTETGWIEAEKLKEGMKILSPVSAGVRLPSTNMALMEDNADLQQDISLEGISTAASLITSAKFFNKQKQYDLYVNAGVKKNSIFPTSYKKKAKVLKVSNPIGQDILIKNLMDSGISGAKILSIPVNNYKLINGDSSTELYLGMEASNIQTHTADFLDYAGLTDLSSKNGWSTKQLDYHNCVHRYKMSLIGDMAKNRPFAKQLVILSYKKFIPLLSRVLEVNQFPKNGLNLLHQKDLPGGTWMTALSNLVHKVVPQFFFTLKDFLKERIKLLLNGLQILDIPQVQNLILENRHKKLTTTSRWEQNLVENGCQTYNNTQSLQWTTNLEKVESVSHAGCEKVYDLEVADNHNFVANGLLVHNCHMLSTAAFNALLKTLEAPPPKVIFILATTDPERVLSTIISRCQRFDYRRIPLTEMTKHLRYIADEENIAIADDALTLISQIANGGLRDAESLLDQLSLLPESISVGKVWDLVGAVPEQDLLALLQAINGSDSLAVLEQCRSLLDRGREPLVVLQNLASFYLNLLIAKTAPQRPDMTAVTETCWQQLCREANNWDTSSILRGQQHLKEAESQLKHTTQPRLWLEVTLLGLLPQVSRAIANQTVTIVNSPPTPSQSQTVTNSQKSIPVAVIPQNTIAVPHVPSEKNITQTPQTPQTTPQPESKPVETANHHPIEQMSNKVPVERVMATELAPVTVSQSVVEPVAPNPNQDPVANQEIWSKVVSCLQPPTTQALLKQRCHLVSFDGLSAIVGISSANLQKLHQGKVPNIEAAFAQVCQRKVRVQLEVANTKNNSANSVNNPVNNSAKNSIPPTKQSTEVIAPPLAEKPRTSPTPADTFAAPNETIKPHNIPVQNQVAQSQVAQTQVTQNVTLQPATLPQKPVNPATTNHNSELGNNPAQTMETPPISSSTSTAIASDNQDLTSPAITELGSNQDYLNADLQQAIESLTHSFEGELVHLDNTDYIEEESPLVPEISSQSNLSSSTKDRPDEEDYGDEW